MSRRRRTRPRDRIRVRPAPPILHQEMPTPAPPEAPIRVPYPDAAPYVVVNIPQDPAPKGSKA